jgi:probable rRNA maturation factor
MNLRSRPALRVRPPLRVEVRSSLRGQVPSAARIARWARAATGARGQGAELAVRIVGTTEGRKLNLLWRGRDYPTNVLSFPVPRVGRSAAMRPLGDIVLCAPVIEREARKQHKRSDAHWAHMVVHGCLHLLGLDHEGEADARRMERRERRILAGFGIADPYLETTESA